MNWSKSIQYLMDAGLSVRDIAQEIGLAMSSVYDLKNGYSKTPSGNAALLLMSLLHRHGWDDQFKKLGAGDTVKADIHG